MTEQTDGIVCVVLPYKGDEQTAKRNIEQVFQSSNIPSDALFAFSAENLGELPHPMQVPDIAEWAETQGVLDSRNKNYATR